MARKQSVKTIMARQKKAVEEERRLTLIETGHELKSWDEIVVRDWTDRPSFGIDIQMTPAFETVKVYPKGRHAKLWLFVDRGTKPHKIRAKNKPRLKFQTAHSARTAPVARANVGTGRSSGPWVAPIEVNHPGSKARDFDKTFLKELSPPLYVRINAATKRGIDKANR